ncbi:MAG: nicotinate (nicotinamide) nucleotide adenylyltransferase [Deltaproteobacteria bacterium]|uniref:nicotinate-nucleotide adenylyltransferase n=1 Tax=Desulfobacula sp. TaxID=2593537 RepID=UPI0019931622|nr:nicotinate (nicotinamide) nucleotide adenylyltransferase [Candidatus Desulfobacula maris]MBL6992323.1 nicotinate (nicotinamide) nucleotide adenylyltransferase [Desulfobacula sp.]
MKAGLFGGTFNPFHNGHIEIIQYVKDRYDLQKIFFIPSATPPHKPDINLAPAKDRFEMVEQSLKGYENFFVSDKELIRKGPSFTIDTINEFKKEYGPKTFFYLLMGSDAFLDITTWKQKEQIFKAIQIIIMLRGHWENYNAIVSFIDENISKGYIFNEQDHTFSHKKKQKIIICKVPKINISSTMIRERVKNRKSIKDLVPANIEKIIRTKELYK